MTILAVPIFAGAVPKVSTRLLPQENAVECVNCDLTHGTLSAIRKPLLIKKLSIAAKTVFKHDSDGWLSWSKPISVVKSAVTDADGEKPLGQLLITGDRAYPTMYLAGGSVYRLGIPRPAAKLTVSLKDEAALMDCDAWAYAVTGLTDAPARYGDSRAEIVAEDGVRVTPVSSSSLFANTETAKAFTATTRTTTPNVFSVSAKRNGASISIVLTGAFTAPLTVEYYNGSVWLAASNLTISASNAFWLQAADATRVRVTDSTGGSATALVDPNTGAESVGSSGPTTDCSKLTFSRSATLEAKAAQLSATAYDGRTDWTGEEVGPLIAAAGFDNAEDWWEGYGDEESVCPWDSASCCIKAGYKYYVGCNVSISRSSAYCYTVVQSLADGIIQYESAPSPASSVIDVPTSDGVLLSGFRIPTDAGLKITHVRIYRTVTGNESSEFHFLAELTLQELAAANWRYVDTMSDRDISTDILATTTWDPIPNNARGLIKTDNGIYAAFRGNELLISEPFIPYAFPASYSLTVEDTIVALAHVDGTIVVLTTGRPYLAQGTVPESLQLVHLPIEQSCVSAKSVAHLPGGVIYASPDGLMLFTSSEQTLLTGKTFSRDQWQALGPANLMGKVHDGRYVGFFEGSRTGLLFNLDRSDIVKIELPEGWQTTALYHHSEDDALYLAATTPQGNGIWRFESGDDRLPYRWRSKDFFTSALCVMSALRVEGEQRPRDPVQVAVFGPDGRRRRANMRLTDTRAKRLPTARSEKLWSFEISGVATVYEIRLGSGVEEIENGA